MPNRTTRTDEATAKLVAKLAGGWSISAACKAAGIGRRTYYDWRSDDPEFAGLADDAIEAGTDRLEDVATRHAVNGNVPLLHLLLKSRRAEKYGDKVDHVHRGLVTFAADWAALRTAILEALEPYPDVKIVVMARIAQLGAGDEPAGR